MRGAIWARRPPVPDIDRFSVWFRQSTANSVMARMMCVQLRLGRARGPTQRSAARLGSRPAPRNFPAPAGALITHTLALRNQKCRTNKNAGRTTDSCAETRDNERRERTQRTRHTGLGTCGSGRPSTSRAGQGPLHSEVCSCAGFRANPFVPQTRPRLGMQTAWLVDPCLAGVSTGTAAERQGGSETQAAGAPRSSPGDALSQSSRPLVGRESASL